MSDEMPVFKHKLKMSLATLFCAAGLGFASFSASAFELYQGEVVHLFSSPVSDEKKAVVAIGEIESPVHVIHPVTMPEPRSGEVVLQGTLSDAANRHSRVTVLPQNSEVQFLDQAERTALLALLSHLQQTDSLIQRTQAYQRPDQRIKFRYDWLRLDLHKINRSILDHLNSPENQTRFFEPLNDDYRR